MSAEHPAPELEGEPNQKRARTDDAGLEHAIDVHTHMYLPRYVQVMRDRVDDLPRIIKDAEGNDKLLILPDEDKDGGAGGRPVHAEYWDVESKLKSMDRNKIDAAVISCANPWLDFVHGAEAASLATDLNKDLQNMCEGGKGRLYGFGMISDDVREAVAELDRMSDYSHVRGIIMGTSGMGNGLDDPALDPVWEKISSLGMTVFIHPHYGIGNEHYDPERFGHSLFLSLGFPFETTVTVAKMVCSGVLARHDNLNLLLAHSGGCLPFLSGRIDACAWEEPQLVQKLQQKPSVFLKRLYYDAITYDYNALRCSIGYTSDDQLLFGTDHPFSISDAFSQYEAFSGLSAEVQRKVRYGNAEKLLNLNLPAEGFRDVEEE